MQAACAWNSYSELFSLAQLLSRHFYEPISLGLEGIHDSDDDNKTWHFYGIFSP